MALVLRSPTESLAPVTAWVSTSDALCWVLLSLPRLQAPPMARVLVLQSGCGRALVFIMFWLRVPPMAQAPAVEGWVQGLRLVASRQITV